MSLALFLLLAGCAGQRSEAADVVTLRETGEEQVELVLVVGEEETVLRTLHVPVEQLSTELFSGVLGYSGFRLTERQGLAVRDPETDWSLRTYYAVEGGGAWPIAESFGWGAPQDYTVDLDGDGGEELVSNVTYGGDGHQDAWVYQRRGDGIWQGRVDTGDLPGRTGDGPAAVVYDAEEEVFRIRYTVPGKEETAQAETRGLERVRFAPYVPLEK